tara:strand:+ start:780 stop:1214 length:435 start_codon:yes stop_codon:yes gene_type:complete
MNNIDIDKEEILKTSKWIRFIFMVVYAFVINFALTISIGLAFIQFLFVLFTSKVNESIASINSHIIDFFNDSIAFLLFQTEEKPFPFKSTNKDEVVIEVNDAEVDNDEGDQARADELGISLEEYQEKKVQPGDEYLSDRGPLRK